MEGMGLEGVQVREGREDGEGRGVLWSPKILKIDPGTAQKVRSQTQFKKMQQNAFNFTE